MTTSILLSPAAAQAGLADELENLGARVLEWPEIRIDAPESCFALDEAIENLFGYDWLILKNEAAAEYFLRRFEGTHQPHELDELKILSIGERTSQALAQAHVHTDIMVDRSGNVFAALEAYVGDVKGLNLLIPSANITREKFAEQLQEAGVRVDDVVGYRTCSDTGGLTRLKALITGGGIDWVTFTEASAVEALAALFDTDDLPQLLADVKVVCIDEVTEAAAHQFGLAHTLSPGEPSALALAQLLVDMTTDA